MPCLNEDETLRQFILDTKEVLKRSGIHGEIIVADNGSTDNSQIIAQQEGARLVVEKKRGYGSAVAAGIRAAKYNFIVMSDSDRSYDLSTLPLFIKKLSEGYDMVIGNRFAGGIEPKAMPWPHQYIGNPILSFLGRMLFRTSARDFHCGLRAIRKEAIMKLHLNSTDMTYDSEMIIKASLLKMRITEIPIKYHCDGRKKHRSYLHTWRDGWLNLMLTIKLYLHKSKYAA